MDALLVIDVQNGMFADPANQPFDGEGVVSRIAALISRARAAGSHVIFIQHDGGEGDVLAEGSDGFAFRAEIAPIDGDHVIVKRFCSGFQNTTLERDLAALDVDRLVICGMQTEYCVDTTVRAAFERGLPVILVADGHTTVDTPTLAARDVVRHHTDLLTSSFALSMPAESITFGGT